MNLSVVLIDGERLSFKVDKDSCVIGRSTQCDVVIQHEAMSRKHCLLEIKNGEIFVTDLASSNGVSVEGQKITPNIPTPYQTYFALSFGAVQSVTINVEERPSERKPRDEAVSSQTVKKSEYTRTKLEKSQPQKSANKTAPPKKDNSKLVKVLILVLVLGALSYFLTKEENIQAPSPEQIYE